MFNRHEDSDVTNLRQRLESACLNATEPLLYRRVNPNYSNIWKKGGSSWFAQKPSVAPRVQSFIRDENRRRNGNVVSVEELVKDLRFRQRRYEDFVANDTVEMINRGD